MRFDRHAIHPWIDLALGLRHSPGAVETRTGASNDRRKTKTDPELTTVTFRGKTYQMVLPARPCISTGPRDRETVGALDDGPAANLGGRTLQTASGDIHVSALASVGIPPTVSVLKIDVEAMERAVFEGGRALIARDRPAIYCEAKTRMEVENVLGFMRPADYMLLATFNASPTHLFVPREASVDLSAVEQLHHQQILQFFRLRDQIADLRERLNTQ